MRAFKLLLVCMLLLLSGRRANAAILVVEGSVTLLSHINQMDPYVLADFNGVGLPSPGNPVPLDEYSSLGLDLVAVDTMFSEVIPGVTEAGQVSQVLTEPNFGLFPEPILGGGSHSGDTAYVGLVGTFNTPVTQVGATFSQNGTQYITAWDASGQLIGQVSFTHEMDSTFMGLDSGSTPIAMIAFGNDDVFNGETYNVGGNTNHLG